MRFNVSLMDWFYLLLACFDIFGQIIHVDVAGGEGIFLRKTIDHVFLLFVVAGV